MFIYNKFNNILTCMKVTGEIFLLLKKRKRTEEEKYKKY